MLSVERISELNIAAAEHPRGLGQLSAASGLVRIDDRLYVIADDEHHLATFDRSGRCVGPLLRLFPGELPTAAKARKAAKPDTETLLHLPTLCTAGALLAFGSGSRPNRSTGVLVAFRGGAPAADEIRHIDLEPLYAPLRNALGELNIEGALISGDALLLLQRGNKGGAPNACIYVALHSFLQWLSSEGGPAPMATEIRRFELGSVEGVPLCFTDGAALSDGAWVFSAVAEDVDDSYNDGRLLGAAVGLIDAGGTLRSLQLLTPAYKVEGIAVELDGDRMTLTMVTDADDPNVASLLLSASWSLAQASGAP